MKKGNTNIVTAFLTKKTNRVIKQLKLFGYSKNATDVIKKAELGSFVILGDAIKYLNENNII